MSKPGWLRWRAVGVVLAMVAIVGLPYVITREGEHAVAVAADGVQQLVTARAQVYRVGYLVHDSEIAAWRLLDGERDDATRERAGRAGHEVPALVAGLRQLESVDAPTGAALGALENQALGRVTFIARALTLVDRADAAGARAALEQGAQMFDLDAGLVAVETNGRALLQEREARAAAVRANGRGVLLLAAIAQFLLLLIVVVASERQIGRRRLAETREGRAILRSQMIFQSVREPIALFNERFYSLLMNPAFAELYGVGGQQRGIPLKDIGHGAWADAVLLQRLKDVVLRDRELWDYEFVQATPDGEERHVVINARRLQQDDETHVLLLTASDVTARALAERRIVELNQQLEGKVEQVSDVNRELEAFSYSVSHDLRAPLRHIAGFARKLGQHLGAELDDKTTHYLDVITESAQRMALLIDDLLVFSRLGRSALRLQAVDMQSLAEQARTLALAGTEERRIVWRIAPLPMVVGDENMLRTVWQNLIGNAVKYTGKRAEARIEVEVERDARGDYVFTVADNGAGFDMQYADKLFGVFQRLHHASEFPGNGIGLANVRRIVARHGGRVWADAEPDHGARFHFSLPATDAAGQPTGEPA